MSDAIKETLLKVAEDMSFRELKEFTQEVNKIYYERRRQELSKLKVVKD